MLYQIVDGSVSLGGKTILSHINFEIRGNEKIAVVGRNGTGKTTLLRLISGELELDRDDCRQGLGILKSRQLTIGMLHQHLSGDLGRTVEEELLEACPCKDRFDRERFAYEMEYDRLFTGFGFSKEDKQKRLEEFSGGEQTKIAFIHLLLMKPDILLLDEPTNHLDIPTVQWLEEYLREYPHAVVMVSHDRFFLDRTAEVIYEASGTSLVRYAGNYTQYRAEKQHALEIRKKAWERQQEEIKRLDEVIERFRHKPTKASFARAKKKQLERMERVSEPNPEEMRVHFGEISPLILGSKWVFTAEHMKIGYEKPILELSLRIRRGQKIGLIGPNGAGKSTFLKTVAGLLPQIAGEGGPGNQVTIGYFDQHTAEFASDKTVLEHFHELFPAMTEKDARSVLGAYLFRGKDAGRKVSELSGGERSRLVLAELLQSRPNFFVLDEPTNHMDIPAKEVLETAFQAYTGTILFVSHDRYFIRQVADAMLIFDGRSAMYHPFGYEHYLERCRKEAEGVSVAEQVRAEDMALIEGMRAVPKAERHRLREIPTEEAYLDWKLRLVCEKMEPAGAYYGMLEASVRDAEQAICESEVYWREITTITTEATISTEIATEVSTKVETEANPSDQSDLLAQVPDQSSDQAPDFETLRAKRDQAWEVWHQTCLEWFENWNGKTF